MKIVKKIFNIAYFLVMIILISVSILSAMSVFGFPSGLRTFVVQSGSMEPSIKTGSIVFVQPNKEYQVGDIITFKVGDGADIKNPKAVVTHRIKSIGTKDNAVSYVTKGDANQTEDLDTRPAGNVLGKVTLSVPYLGYPVGYAKTQTGFIVMIVIPATIIIYSEFLNIKKEVVNILNSKKAVKKKSHEKTV